MSDDEEEYWCPDPEFVVEMDVPYEPRIPKRLADEREPLSDPECYRDDRIDERPDEQEEGRSRIR